ncbi:5'-nucleotidase, lipoprotein e(P4) family [Shewanella avicenniae]|uniref:5'-nucleotidase, lipoprotein e(P4) family n=1 Tax=Shewanella avicenniae TaxID=2814294 RepID=A0ABX7QSL2_9GAMM|nr:5'-nucleotidase, lipoprotein e(P4) family [Shewanella avicenniae]QSX34234.1 5'-nucleotidase, lipoprotein e(P4) family [Shewanella avicenniae]
MKLAHLFVPLALVAAAAQAEAPMNHAAMELVAQNTQSVVWMQHSGEYRALCYQAYNMAKVAFELAKTKQQGKLAVMVDLDETMVDNSPYAAWQLLHHQGYTTEGWDAWVNSVQTPAIAGAVDLANFVTANGGTMFYVSNRSDRTFAATQQNLQKLGFPNVTEFTLRLKKDTSNKAPRLASIEQDGYKVVLFMGDNLNDFPEINTYHQQQQPRNALVDANKDAFGHKFILLPNPSYGDWEPAMAKDYYQLTDGQKLDVRQQSLRPWQQK